MPGLPVTSSGGVTAGLLICGAFGFEEPFCGGFDDGVPDEESSVEIGLEGSEGSKGRGVSDAELPEASEVSEVSEGLGVSEGSGVEEVPELPEAVGSPEVFVDGADVEGVVPPWGTKSPPIVGGVFSVMP